ncbi:MAG: hypothetical protein GY772_20510 [bacterium]|nr:hypothetical protein [bacterium]
MAKKARPGFREVRRKERSRACQWVDVPVIDVEEKAMAERAVAWMHVPAIDVEDSDEEVAAEALATQREHREKSNEAPGKSARRRCAALAAAAAPRNVGAAPRMTRWGRCGGCLRAMRPFVSLKGEPLLVCSNAKANGFHSRHSVPREEVAERGFPLRFVRRVRIGL